MKNRNKEVENSAKADIEEQKLNLLQADAYFKESKLHFPSDLLKSKDFIEKAISFSPENKDYLLIYNEINRLININPSNPNMLSHYFQELINFLESKMDVKLITADQNSFSLTSKPKIEQDLIYNFNYKKSLIFAVEEKDGQSILSAVELKVLDNGQSLERTLMQIPVWRGMTADEFAKSKPN